MDELEILLYRTGGSTPFLDWLASLKDGRAVRIVRARLNRIRLGSFGPGYRVYYGRDGSRVVVLLCGGSKRTQTSDIIAARAYWKEYLDAEKTG